MIKNLTNLNKFCWKKKERYGRIKKTQTIDIYLTYMKRCVITCCMCYREAKRSPNFLKRLYFKNAPKKNAKKWFCGKQIWLGGLADRQSQFEEPELPLRSRGTSLTQKEFCLKFLRWLCWFRYTATNVVICCVLSPEINGGTSEPLIFFPPTHRSWSK